MHSSGPRYLNLGCGERFHSDWVNLDIRPVAQGVRQWDLSKDLPFANGFFDVVYHSHVLEHFSKQDGARLLRECFRVLRSGGIIRVAVPDLERIARLYLEALEKSLSGDKGWQARYEWILLEMHDQAVRDSPGGEMLAYLRQDPIPERQFVESRLGGELRRITAPPSTSAGAKPSFWNLLSRKAARLALGRPGIQAHDVGIFRKSGEVHRRMYDRYSLARALEHAGFQEPEKRVAAESSIPGWVGFCLDTEPDGSVYKPDSLFMEAMRP